MTVLGILNFFRSHVPAYAEIAKPLSDALSSRKSKSYFQLGDDAQRAFAQLKELVCQAPVLVPPKYGKPFHLYTDASLYAVGCCLTQVDELGDEHPIAYGVRNCLQRNLIGVQLNEKHMLFCGLLTAFMI